MPDLHHRHGPFVSPPMAAFFNDRVSFTVPATSGQYAPEVLALARPVTALAPSALVGVTALIESNAATGATVELWLLKIGGDPTNTAHYFVTGKSITTGADTWPLASWPGAQIRVKSGGTAGACVVNATADIA